MFSKKLAIAILLGLVSGVVMSDVLFHDEPPRDEVGYYDYPELWLGQPDVKNAPMERLWFLHEESDTRYDECVEVAEKIGGEIVSADAFAIYRGLDIGTDKPTAEDRRRIPHHMVDVADPRDRFSAGEFANAAAAAIEDIKGRGREAVVVGGTHFYIYALLEGLFPSPPRDPAHGQKLADEWARDPASVVERLREVDPESARRIGLRFCQVPGFLQAPPAVPRQSPRR